MVEISGLRSENSDSAIPQEKDSNQQSNAEVEEVPEVGVGLVQGVDRVKEGSEDKGVGEGGEHDTGERIRGGNGDENKDEDEDEEDDENGKEDGDKEDEDGNEEDEDSDEEDEDKDDEQEDEDEDDDEEDEDEDEDEDEGEDDEENTEEDKVEGVGKKEDSQREHQKWSDRISTALTAASTPRSFAASKVFWRYPNPFLTVQSDKSSSDPQVTQSGSTPATVNLGFPLSKSQTQELHNQRCFVADKSMGLDIIPSKFITIQNEKFTSWVWEEAGALSKKLGIEGVNIELDFSFALDGKQQVSGFGDRCESVGNSSIHQATDIHRFGKLLVVLPAFDKFTVKVCSPGTGGVFTAQQEPTMTMLTFWYDGALPTISSSVSMTPGLCLVYTVYISHKEVTKRHYEPLQLRIPNSNAAIIAELKDCLNDWISQIKAGEAQSYLPLVLDEYTHHTEVHLFSGNDAARHDFILHVLAKLLGLQVCLVEIDIEQTADETAAGWGYNYYYAGCRAAFEQACVDKNGKYYWDKGSIVNEEFKLGNFYDLQQGCRLVPQWECKIPPGTTFAQPTKFTSATPGLEQEFDDEEGTLVNQWSRSALIFWPSEFRLDALVNLFGWNAISFIFNKNPSGSNEVITDVQRVALVERILKQPQDLLFSQPSSNKMILLNFALQQRRADLFLAVLKKTGPPDLEKNLKLIHEAMNLFANEPDIIKGLVGDYSYTAYWLLVLEKLATQDVALIHTYLPRITSAHKPAFDIKSLDLRSYPNGEANLTPKDIWICSTTYKLLRYVFSSPHPRLAASVLCSILATYIPDSITPRISKSAFLAVLPGDIQSLLAANNISPREHPSIQHFYQVIWLKDILPPLGTPPIPIHAPTNFSLPGHRCAIATCLECNQLHSFLINKDMDVWTSQMIKPRSDHIQTQLQSWYPYREFIKVGWNKLRGRLGTLIVSKINLAYADLVRLWESRRVLLEVELNKINDAVVVNDEENLWGKIRAAVKAGGQGYTRELALAAEKFLKKDFPLEVNHAKAEDIDSSSGRVMGPNLKRRQEQVDQVPQGTQEGPSAKKARSSGKENLDSVNGIPIIDLVDSE